MRSMTNGTANREPRWRHNQPALTTGYNPRWPHATDEPAGRHSRPLRAGDRASVLAGDPDLH
jgi:hydrogenase small subunit